MYCCLQVCRAIIDGSECGFQTESALALETHMSTSHINRAGRYCCARCPYTAVFPNHFRSHVLERHGLIGIISRPAAFFNCKVCSYETNHSQARVDVSKISVSKSLVVHKATTDRFSCLLKLIAL